MTDPANLNQPQQPAVDSVGEPATGTLCPYCGHVSANPAACDRCRGLFQPLSRQASQNAMGPWFIRDEANPFRPGCNYATLKALISRTRVRPDTVLRGPTTRQFWMLARNVPGVAHLLGECHVCHGPVRPSSEECRHCGVIFEAPDERQFLGLAPIRLLPGHSTPEQIARHAYGAKSVQAQPVIDEHPGNQAQGDAAYNLAPTPQADELADADPEPAATPPPLPRRHRDPETFEDLAGSLLAERRRSSRSSNRMALVGILIALGALGLLLIILAALPNSSGPGATGPKPAAGAPPPAPAAR